MKTKRLITAICGITLASVSIFNNFNINNINAVEDSEIGVIEEHVENWITYGTYNCGDCIIEYSYSGVKNSIVARRITHVENKDEVELNIPAYIHGIPVTRIESSFVEKTFKDNIISITIPDTVNYIGYNAFSNCTNLKEVTISDSAVSIGNYAFSGCSGLTSITIPDSVTSIGLGAFSGCTKLEKVTILDSVTSIGDNAFESCYSLKEIKIPNSVTSIGKFAFAECCSLESVELSNNIKELCLTFYGCTNLESVTIPESVIYIDNAFNGCLNLKSLIIPESVEAFFFDFNEIDVDEFSLTILSDNLYISPTYRDDIWIMSDYIYDGRMKIYAHENSTVYNAYKYTCYYNRTGYNNGRNTQEEYEEALSKFNIIENDTDTDDDTQWYTVVKSADVNNDGKIDASDASDILNYYAYISTGGELSFEDFTALKE